MMTQKKLIFLILAVLIIGIFIYGYSRATPPVENGVLPRPQIEVAPKFFDFGEIKFGAVVNYDFKVKNLGNQLLEIKRVATSCACTTAKTNKEIIGPGEETELIVTYDTKAMGEGPHGRGKQERIIYIRSNDPVKPQEEVMIYTNVK